VNGVAPDLHSPTVSIIVVLVVEHFAKNVLQNHWLYPTLELNKKFAFATAAFKEMENL
jgi:hypothetical protein